MQWVDERATPQLRNPQVESRTMSVLQTIDWEQHSGRDCGQSDSISPNVGALLQFWFILL